jgi:hypothetical protein
MLCVLAVTLPVCVLAEGLEPQQVRFANGIEATIYSPEYILQRMTVQVGGELLFLVDDVRYHFIDDADALQITNPGDGKFHPMSIDAVLAAIGGLRIKDAGLQILVFVLPYPRREVVDSSARADMIFLSPGVREVSEYAIHFTVTHELGHIYQYKWMPDHEIHAWNHYRSLRNIRDRRTYHARSTHRNRPHEVFAEDFRFLFGDVQSTYSGSIENPELPLPAEVDGLAEFMLSVRQGIPSFAARLKSVPNPFNPNTEINIEFSTPPGTDPVRVNVYDGKGSLVRRLHQGPVSSRNLRVPWDGRAEDGAAVASGVYFARMDYAGTHSTTKLMLIK